MKTSVCVYGSQVVISIDSEPQQETVEGFLGSQKSSIRTEMT